MQKLETHVKSHPDLCIEELQDHLPAQPPNIKNTSETTIFRALNFDLRLKRKNMMKVARESAQAEI